MAKDELGYQGDIVAGVRGAGGYAEKLSHRFKVGIPDLILKYPAWEQPKIWEVKLVRPLEVLRDGTVNVKTTELQRKVLRDMRHAVMDVGVLVILPGPGRDVRIVLLDDIERQKINHAEIEKWKYTRTLGQDWGQAIWEMVESRGKGLL